MVKITSIEQLRPDLLNISDNELERQMTELQMEADRRAKLKEEQELLAKNELKNTVITNYVNVLREMYDFKLLPDEVVAYYTNSGGTFAPHMRHKRLKTQS